MTLSQGKRAHFPLVVLLVLCAACSREPPDFWPRNGTSFQDIRWTAALEDSSSVLRIENGIWILPEPAGYEELKSSRVRHLSPDPEAHDPALYPADQEVVHEIGPIQKEYCGFGPKGVLLLGFSSGDSSSLFTLYKPPLVLLPKNLGAPGTMAVSEAVPYVWDALSDTFRTEPLTRIRLTIENYGRVRLGSGVLPAVLCRLALSRDRTLGYGQNNLIVPDAVKVENRVLLARGVGPVLEWGIRSALPEREVSADLMRMDEPGGMPDKPGRFIEIVLHRMEGPPENR